jgi:Mn2+/Fe2+ NRAMP family transporter
MPPVRQRLRDDLFQTRTDVWRSAGLAEEVEMRGGRPRKGLLLLTVIIIAGVLVGYGRRAELAPGYETWIQVLSVVLIVVAGTAAATWLGRRSYIGASTPPPRARSDSWCGWSRSGPWSSSPCGSLE